MGALCSDGRQFVHIQVGKLIPRPHENVPFIRLQSLYLSEEFIYGSGICFDLASGSRFTYAQGVLTCLKIVCIQND